MQKVRKAVFAIIAMSFVLLVGACHRHEADSKNNPIAVLTAKVRKVNIPQTLTAVGTIKAIQSVSLSFNVSGQLVNIYPNNGETVKKGQKIAKLDDQSDLAVLRADKAAYQLAQATYQRMLTIRQYGAISDQTIDQQHASMVQAQAQLQGQQVLVNQKTLKAPFAGVLGNFQFSIGAYIPSGTTVVRLVQESPLEVDYSVPADQRPQLEIGQDVQVTTSAYPNKVFSGIVSFISPEVNKGSATITIAAKVDNPDFLLLPGMFVSVTQVLQQQHSEIVVPNLAISTDVNGQYIYKVVDGKAQKDYVSVGEISGNNTQVIAGAVPGDVVVVAGQQKLQPGSAVTLLNDSKLPAEQSNLTTTKTMDSKAPAKKSTHSSKSNIPHGA